MKNSPRTEQADWEDLHRIFAVVKMMACHKRFSYSPNAPVCLLRNYNASTTVRR